MGNSYFWGTIIPLGIGTLLIRMSFIFFGKHLKLSEKSQKLFSYIPAAVFPAMFAPMTFFYQGSSEALLGKERVLAMLFAIGVSFKTKSLLISILAGLILVYFLK